VQIPRFPECRHPSIKTLSNLSDPKLLMLFQEQPDCGLYFMAIFCRYSAMTYVLIQHLARSPAQVDYLFALTWRTIFHELKTLQLQENSDLAQPATLQSWLLEVTGACIHQLEIPSVESIRYSLSLTPPPLWCYVEAALDYLPPKLRLIIVMAHTCQWNETLIASYLTAEGEMITTTEATVQLREAYQLLQAHLPEDIRAIYLNTRSNQQVTDFEKSGSTS
jgi:hypothetical protein